MQSTTIDIIEKSNGKHTVTYETNAEPLASRLELNSQLNADRPKTPSVDESIPIRHNQQTIDDEDVDPLETMAPKLFFVVESDGTKDRRRHFRLHFLCECHENIHRTFHPGYEILKPRDFFRKFGSYLRHLIRVNKSGVFIDDNVVPSLATLASEIFIPKELANEQSSADLHQIAKFLSNVDSRETLGQLYPIRDVNGDVRWVCIRHLQTAKGKTKQTQLIEAIQWINGVFDPMTNRLTFEGRGYFVDMNRFLSIIQEGLRIDELYLHHCILSRIDFQRLLTTVQYSFIHVLVLDNVHVRNQNLRKINKLLDDHFADKKDFVIVQTIESIVFNVELLKRNNNLFTIYQDSAESYLQILPDVDYPWERIPRVKSIDLISTRQLRIFQMTMTSQLLDALSNLLGKDHTVVRVALKTVDLNLSGVRNSLDRLTQMLGRSQSLRSLMFSHCRLPRYFFDDLFQLLQRHSNLEELMINSQKFNLSTMEKLHEFLQMNDSLVRLHLSRNQLSTNDIRSIVDACYSKRTLKYLDLTENQFDTDGLETICKMLQKNLVLEEIKLSLKQLTEEDIQIVAEAILNNKTLRVLHLFGRTIDDNGLLILRNAVERNSTLERVVFSSNGWSENARLELKKTPGICFL